MIQREFGTAGDQVLVEEKLTGPEVSVLAFVDKYSIYILELAQDHKPIGEGDTGPNTGGMGAYSPMTLIDDGMLRHIEGEVLVPIVDAMRNQGITYRGVLYAGLMLTAGGPKVLEFNCRFGDPEAQPLLMRLRTDLLDVVEAVIEDRAGCDHAGLGPAGGGVRGDGLGRLPGEYEKGKPITGWQEANAVPDTVVFHAGTAKMGHQIVTNGGRVLGSHLSGQDPGRGGRAGVRGRGQDSL
jgi:phosphoribosylamine---glycine ligase